MEEVRQMLWYRALKKDLQGPSSQQVYFTSSIFQLKLSWCVHIQCAGVVGMRGLDPQRVCSKFSPVLSVETSWRLDETGHRSAGTRQCGPIYLKCTLKFELKWGFHSFHSNWGESHTLYVKNVCLISFLTWFFAAMLLGPRTDLPSDL